MISNLHCSSGLLVSKWSVCPRSWLILSTAVMSWIRFFYSCLCFVYLVKSSNPRYQIWARYYKLHLRISARDTSLEKPQVGVGRSISNILFHVTYLACLKAETHDATNRCDTSPRHVAATNAATEFCRCDLSHEFKLVWIRATYRRDKISASSFVAAAVQTRRRVAAICRIVCLGLYNFRATQFIE